MKLALLSALNTERAARRATVMVTDAASGEERLIRASLHRDHTEAVRAFVEKRAPNFGKK